MNHVRNHEWAVFLASMLLTILVIDYIVGPPPPRLIIVHDDEASPGAHGDASSPGPHDDWVSASCRHDAHANCPSTWFDNNRCACSCHGG